MFLYNESYKNMYIGPVRPHNAMKLCYTSSDHNKVSFHRHKVYETPWLKR